MKVHLKIKLLELNKYVSKQNNKKDVLSGCILILNGNFREENLKRLLLFLQSQSKRG